MLLAFFAYIGLQYSMAQTVHITGTVTSSEDKQPLAGATVIVKGTAAGALTDASGKYSLDVPSNTQTIVVSFVGYKSMEIAVAGRNMIDIELQSEALGLEEVVVTGVGTATDRRRVAISVETVKSKDLGDLPTASIDQALEGKVAGALIQSISGQPGQQSNIILRGINSLGSNQPMIMIDGIEINTDNNTNGFQGGTNVSSRLSDLDLSNIDRVEIVQGAAAATIYGAQGANGVIQIFTKKGKPGQTDIIFNTSISSNEALRGNFKQPSTHYYNTNGTGYIVDSNGNPIVANAGGANGWYAQPGADVTDPNSLCNKPFKEQTYNPLDYVFRDATVYNNSLQVRGGNNNSTYAMLLSDLHQQSVITGSLDRINADLNVTTELFKNFKVSASSTYVNSTNTTGTITGDQNTASALGGAMFTRPYEWLKLRDAQGNYMDLIEQGSNSQNPEYVLNYEHFSGTTNRIIENVNLNYKPFKFLELDYKYGIDEYSYKYQDFIANQSADAQWGFLNPEFGHINTLTDKGTTQNSIFSAFLTFTPKDFTFKTQVSYDWRDKSFDEIQAQVTGIPANNNVNLAQGATPYVTEYTSDFITFGVLVNQRIEYKELAGISGGFRTDWSSAFGAASTPFTFPRADAYFRLSQLQMWDPLKNYLPELKLRAAYGQAGIQPGPFDRVTTLLTNTIGSQSWLLSQLTKSNPNLQVQVSKEFEFGLDLKFKITNGIVLNNGTFSPTYWTRTSNDVIYTTDIALSNGSSNYLNNSFSLGSHGFQASLNLDVIATDNFGWSLTSTYGQSETTVTNISNHLDVTIGVSGSGGFVLRQGAKLGVFFGNAPLSSVSQKSLAGVPFIDPSQYSKYTIVNGYVTNIATKTVVYSTDQTVIGDPTPKFTMSFINDFRVGKYLRLSFQIDWFAGLQVYNQTRQWLYRDGLSNDWTKSITVGDQTGPYTAWYNSLYNGANPASPFVEDASFVRLRNLTLAIDLAKIFPVKFTKQVELSFTGHNLLTISRYSGLDPEAASYLNDPTQRGLDNMAFPNSRTFTGGLKITF